MNTTRAKFSVGQIVHHTKFDYRGVVVDVDPVFQGTEEWYERVAVSRPPKDQPWYHVLVHQSEVETYVAERHLEIDDSDEPVDHPYVPLVFAAFEDGRYIAQRRAN